MLTRALKTTTPCILALLALALAMPAAAAAAVTEVGMIEKTTPATAPSCTAGPLGSVGKALEEEEKQQQREAKEREERKKRHKHHKKKHHKGKKASRRRGRHAVGRKASRDRSRRRAGVARILARAASVAGETTATTTTTSSTTSSEEATQPASGEATASPEAPCLAVSRTTGFQMKVGPVNHPLVIPRDGRIVAWTVQLGRPTASQTKFFDENEGGPASAGLALLSPVKDKSATTPMYHLLAQSPLISLEPYFGMTAQFPLAQTIKVKKGDLVALTVPTWAPALALGFGKNTSWRASRQKGQCSVTNTQTAQSELKSNVQYFCQYRTARLTYSATLISTP